MLNLFLYKYLHYTSILDFSEEWLGSIKTIEEIKLLFTKSNVIHTHPQLLQEASAKFQTIIPDRFKYAVGSFWLSPEAVDHVPFGPMHQPRLTALNYFFVQTPPDQSGAQPVQIPYSDAMRRIREVHYNRGTIVNAMDIEAKEMADRRKRHDSFSKSDNLKGKVVV